MFSFALLPLPKRRRVPALLGLAALSLGLVSPASAQETVGGGTVASPAAGPAPSFTPPGVGSLVLVKNWHFGTSGTVKNYADMNANFLYHDQHNSIANGSNAYGSLTVAPDDANAIFPGDVYYYNPNGTSRGNGTGQPIEGRDSAPVRQFTADSLKTFLTPLSHATTLDASGVLTVLPDRHEVGNGSFMASWFLPAGGSLLGQDIVWETKVRYKTPPYFWFSLWTDGNDWNNGAEHDLVETYGEDYLSEGAGTAHGNNNFDGHLWHANSVAGSDTVDYFAGAWWGAGMDSVGITSYDAALYHTWTWVYKKDNTYAMYVDGVQVQSGSNYYWTTGAGPTGTPINMSFRFDAGWGHIGVKPVDKPLAASALAGTYYEFAYSRVYLSPPVAAPAAGLLANGSFETPNVGTGGYQYSPAGSSWAFSGNAGIQANGSAWGAVNAADGTQTAFLQGNSALVSISQSVSFPAAGSYALTFKAARRFGQVQPVRVTLDGATAGTVTPTSNAFLLQSVTLTVPSAGAHTVALSATDTTGDSTTFVDQAGLNVVAASSAQVANGSFETPRVSGYQYNPMGGSWTFGGNAGIQANGSAWGAASATDGTQTAFLQGVGSLGSVSQAITFPAAGSYALTFQAAQRSYGSGVQPVQVSLDGTNQGGPVAPAGTSFSAQSVTLTVASAGSHTLKLSATDATGDRSTFVDSVAVAAVAGSGALITGTEFDDGAGPWSGNQANAASNAFDGDPATFYDCNNGTGYVGLDAGVPSPVSKIVFAPRAVWEGRMVGGIFEGSNTSATSGYTTLATVTQTPSDGLSNTLTVSDPTAYRWLRYRDSQGGNCNVAEIQFVDPPAGVPALPASLKAAAGAVGTKKISLTWAAASGAVSYHVLRSLVSGYTGTQALAVNVADLTFADTGLTAGKTYYYKITAVNTKGASQPTAQVSAAAR